MEELVIQYGPGGLFLAAFLAATLLPFSSEAALAAAVGLGMPAGAALLWASAGNCLACLVNYYLGRFLGGPLLRRTVRSRGGRSAYRRIKQHGTGALWLAWLPIIGDPITVLAGVFRMNLSVFLAIVWSTRIARYVVLLLIIKGVV